MWSFSRDQLRRRAVDLASLTMLETRLTARSYQLEYDRAGDIPFIVYDGSDPAAKRPVRDPAASARVKEQTATAGGVTPRLYEIGPDVEAIEAYVADPSRTMMGPVQEGWLQATLTRSVASGKPWQLIGNEVIMGRCRSPKIAAVFGPDDLAKVMATLPPDKRAEADKLIAVASYDQPFDLDGWDGYPAARARFDRMLQGLAGGNVIVVSGDSHAFWTNRLQPQSGGATWRWNSERARSPARPSPKVWAAFSLARCSLAQNREVVFCDQLSKGYVLLEPTPTSAVSRMIAVPIDAKPYQAHELAAWRVEPTAGRGLGPLQKL